MTIAGKRSWFSGDVVDKLHKLARQRTWEMLEVVVQPHEKSLSMVGETHQNAL
jgi:hypothetical protein